MRDNTYYVACLDLSHARALVVGGGPVALEKIDGLLDARATVTAVAPEAIDEVHELARAGVIELRLRPYEDADLDGCLLVIAATSDDTVNRRVHEGAVARSLLVNVADVPELCNFILPAIARRGPLAMAISTAGASPALAQRMRDEAAGMFGPAYAELAALLAGQRAWARRQLSTYRDRKLFFDAIVGADPDPIALLGQGRRDEVLDLIEREKENALADYLRSRTTADSAFPQMLSGSAKRDDLAAK